MRLKSWIFAICFLSTLVYPKVSHAQFMATWVFSPPENAERLLMGGVAVPIFHHDRVAVGPGFSLGGIWDSADPARNGRHVHLTWMPTAQITVRVAGPFGIALGHGWGFVKKDAKPHLKNYKTWFAGVVLGH